jgi:5-methylcytosine-specific restriction endonuclease McrA
MYEDKLLDSRWLKKSKSIKQRDCYRCTKCRSRDRLEVHHKVYVSGRQPWEYDDRYLVTLCNKCHAKVHENNPGSNFLTRDKKIIRDSSIVKKKQKQYKKKWLRDAMSLMNSMQ